MKIRLAAEDDNQSLCWLDSLCTQGKGLVFHYQREDFFRRSRLYDKWAVYLAEAEGVVVGSVSACLKNVRLNGSYVDVGYVFDLRVHPDYRLKGVAMDLLTAAKEYLLQHGVQYGYTYVLGSNTATLKMVRKRMGMYMAAPFRVFFLSSLQRGPKVIPVRNGEGLDGAWKRIEASHRRYDLSERRSFLHGYHSLSPGAPFRGIFTLPGLSYIQGCLWDSSVYSAKVVDHIPLPLRVGAALPQPARRLLGLPALPSRGEILRVLHIFDVVWDGEDNAAARKLIKGLRTWAGREGARIVMCHLDARDPLCAVMKKQAFYSLEGALLLRTPIEGEKPPPLSLAYLDIRDF